MSLFLERGKLEGFQFVFQEDLTAFFHGLALGWT